MRQRHVLLVLATCASIAIAGCAEEVRIGSSCLYTSECPEGLACVNGRCGRACVEHRDCPRGAECLHTANGTRCSLANERCPCDEGLVCGNDERCHSACGDPCPDGVCASDGTCRRETVAAADAGALAVPEHVPCESAPLCGAGHVCVGDPDAVRACRRPCDAAEDCALEGSVCRLFGADPGVFACTLPCDPVSAAGCVAGEACDWLDGPPPHFECRGVESAGAGGDACGSPSSCAAGLACAGARCVRWCRIGDASACALDETCRAFEGAPRTLGAASFGFCATRSAS